MVKSASEFIETQGAEKIADAMGRRVGTVRVWKCRNRFPRGEWLELSQMFPELTLDVLKGMEAQATARAA